MDSLPDAWLIHPNDSVAVALSPLAAGTRVSVAQTAVLLRQAIPRGHKLALCDLPVGATILKFGHPIGTLTASVQAGDHIHVHNLATNLRGGLEATWAGSPAAVVSPPVPALGFAGYPRADGRVGTRQEIWIIATVGCVRRTVERIAAVAAQRHLGRIGAIRPIVHPFGCSQVGPDLDATRQLLAALASHPNAGGVLVVGLGCESNQAARLMAGITGRDDGSLRYLGTQQAADEVAEGVALVDELVERIAGEQPVPCGLKDLVVGLKCGGSDGLSGLTANPLVGRIADAVTQAGGKAILSEIPECFGAEQLLLGRATTPAVFERLMGVLSGFRQYFHDHGEPLHENPSPGNLEGGITTLEEKSLGAVQKGGGALVTDAILYGEKVSVPGLTVLEAPGNDAVSSTALAAAGANVILFTTGRGTPLGFPVPTIKIASNSNIAARKPHWIDFDAGTVLNGGDWERTTTELLELTARIAGGEPTCAERAGESEIAIWKRGVTL
jgi:altronate hydrolase